MSPPDQDTDEVPGLAARVAPGSVRPGEPTDDVLEAFLEWAMDLGLELYPAQEEAILELYGGSHVVLKTPTGSGKSMVANAMHFLSLATGRRSFYTSPIKALASEKFLSLCRVFGAENVGLMTGDSSVNRDAPILCCTAEVLSNMALRQGARTQADFVCMDEFHYYSDRDRGMAWQVPLLTLPNARFLLMSATLGDTSDVEAGLEELTGAPAAVVSSDTRPVPLEFRWSEDPLHELLEELVGAGLAPVYLVNFTQRECAEQAQGLMSTKLSSKDEKKAIADAIADERFRSAYGKVISKYLRHGVGLHHAGLLPRYRLLVEKLAQKGLLKVICGTDTLGVGVNVPIRTVVFTKLCKYDGESVRILSVRDFKQIAGRAGRAGYDTAGLVVAQAPEHVIDNRRLVMKAGGDAKKLKKIVRKKPPERGFKPWNEETFQGLIERAPEPLEGVFDVGHGLVLTMLQRDAPDRPGGPVGFDALRELIERAHARDAVKQRLVAKAEQVLESLVAADIVDQQAGADGDSVVSVVADDLQDDFSLHHSLSLFLVDALSRLDPEDPEYALDVVSVVESVLEHPRVVLVSQERQKKGEIIGRLKAEGVPYEERMEAIEDVTYDKPKAEWLYEVFDAFREHHPWLRGDNVRPKSIARAMIERWCTFDDYVRDLGLERFEGVVLRYLTSAYKTLVQNVPEADKTDELHDAIGYLRVVLERVDASLVEEWERMRYGEVQAREVPDLPEPPRADLLRDRKAFRARVRAELHALVKALSEQDWELAATLVREDPDDLWTPQRFEQALAPLIAEHGRVRFDHAARLADKTTVSEDPARHFTVAQALLVPEPDDLEGLAELDPDAADLRAAVGWALRGEVDLREDFAPEGVLLTLRAIGP